MNLSEALAQHFGMMYRVAEMNLEGMTHEQSLIQPGSGGNCANWILGHLVNVQNGAMELLGEAPVWESEDLARAGWTPITGELGAIDWNILKDRFLDSRERFLAAVSMLSEKVLAEDVPDPFGGRTSRAKLLNTLAFHQAYHAGQLGLVRRIAGLPGAVKGPGQAQVQPA